MDNIKDVIFIYIPREKKRIYEVIDPFAASCESHKHFRECLLSKSKYYLDDKIHNSTTHQAMLYRPMPLQASKDDSYDKSRCWFHSLMNVFIDDLNTSCYIGDLKVELPVPPKVKEEHHIDHLIYGSCSEAPLHCLYILITNTLAISYSKW